MEEVVHRRYRRLLEEDSGLPQLIVIDGGKGQLSYEIVGSQKAELTLRPPVCSSSQCSGKIKYYIMTSPKKVQLYSQLVCPSSYFTIGDISKDPIKE